MAVLGDLTWPEAGEHRGPDRLLAVPVGATEQHGPHLPLSTDTDIAVALTDRLARALPSVLAGPPLAYGASGEHDGFPGTLSIGREAVELVLVELGRSASASFAHVLFVSAHGGNAEPVAAAVRRLQREGRGVLAWSPRWRGDAHAGRIETSVMLALHPGRVRADRAAPGSTAPLVDLMPALRAGGVRGVSRNGVLGNPTAASTAEGRRLLDEAGDDLLATASDWMARTPVPS